ncbi:hypothetical protein [Pseudoalteromonas mariniglutinosa]|uniref:hypothetical protein n=1 Tax=Pseudoalteromonas mariniglutinosa TaxID=206042 RepID=UPI00384B2689
MQSNKENAVKTFLLSLALLSPLTLAQECDIDSQYVQANYRVTSQADEAKASQTQLFTLWRTPHQVAKQGEQLVEMWQQLRNQQIRPIRYFQKQQRGIEYQPAEVQGHQDWHSKYQLISNQLLAKMTLKSEQMEGCEHQQRYQLQEGDSHIELVWLANQKLLKSMQISKPSYQQTITLQSVNFAKQVVLQQFAIWDRYQTTDYADIGDNESDPFLAKMINLGFIEHGASGFYNADGKVLQGGHSH